LTWAFVERGCASAWFWAGGSGDTAVICEGFGAKALALVSAGVEGVILGGGSRAWLGNDRSLPPGIKRAIIVADRRPAEDERDADGKPSAERHDRDYRRTTDRLLLALGENAVTITSDPPGGAKDADQLLRLSDAEAVRQWIASAQPAKLSQDGWAFKLGLMPGNQYELARERLAREYAEAFGGSDGAKVRLAFLDSQRAQGQHAVFMEALRNRGKDGGAALDLAGLDFGEDDDRRGRLVAIAAETDLFQDDGDDGYCCIGLGGGARRTLKIEGAAFSDWLIAEYGRRFPEFVAGRQVPGSVSSSTLSDATRTILAMARQGDTRRVFLRLGWDSDRVYLDMAAPEPRAIEISPDGWSIVQDPPVHLVFLPTAKPLPVPVPGLRKTVLRQLRRFFGFRVKDDRFVLLVGVMMAGLMPRGPYPILILSGEQGSGKTTRSRFMRLTRPRRRCAAAHGLPRTSLSASGAPGSPCSTTSASSTRTCQTGCAGCPRAPACPSASYTPIARKS
jgi:hypothetical protein